jgi:tryptophan synthase alpha chain
MSRRLAEVFSRAKSTNRAALIGYLPAGYPTAAASVELMNTMIDAGVDAIEVGLPYSDPLMDGADIQFAVAAALAGGTGATGAEEDNVAVAETCREGLNTIYEEAVEAIEV